MEQVLSLQTYERSGVVLCSRTCVCNTIGCTTKSCTFSCAAFADEELPEWDGSDDLAW